MGPRGAAGRNIQVSAAATLFALSVPGLANPTENCDAAGVAYERRHWLQVIAALERSADGGHVRAPTMLGMMLGKGERLHGEAVRQGPVAAKRRPAEAAASGSATASRFVAQLDAGASGRRDRPGR